MSIVSEQHFGIARKIVSNITVQSWDEIPHAVLVYEADITKLMDVYKKINREFTDKSQKITVNTIMLKCICEGLIAAPELNSHLTFNKKLVRGCLTVYDNIDISMPMLLPDGQTMTVNMHDMGSKSLTEIRDAIRDTADKASKTNIAEVMYEVSIDNTIKGLKKGKIRQTINRLIGSKTGKHKVKSLSGSEKKAYYSIPTTERLTKHDVEQGTVTVTNLGSVYRKHKGFCTLLEIIPPQTTAFAIDSIQKRPVAVCDENGNDIVEVHSILPITIAFDHRAFDYKHIIPLLERFDEIFDDPSVIENWV